MILGFCIDGDSIGTLAKESIKKYSLNEDEKEEIITLILSFDEQRYCGDCVNSKWEGGCESSINGPAEPGYHYCGLLEEEKEELENIQDSVECFERGDCDASRCHKFIEKDEKRIRKTRKFWNHFFI